jgi:hypothetical protein
LVPREPRKGSLARFALQSVEREVKDFMNKTMTYKVWDTKTKQLFQVTGIDYTQQEIYPVTEDEDKRLIPMSEGLLLP